DSDISPRASRPGPEPIFMASPDSAATPTFQGSMVALVTPMQPDGSLDYAAYRSLIDWHIAEGTDALVVVGTTGESPTVSMEEHAELIRVAVEHAAGRIPVIAGVGANSTDEAEAGGGLEGQDRKSTRLNSSHVKISYAVFCLKKKTWKNRR